MLGPLFDRINFGLFSFAVLLTVVTACGSPHEPSGPTDTVRAGKLCVPSATDCPTLALLERETTGANTLDYRLRNRGDTSAEVRLIFELPEGVEQDDAGRSDLVVGEDISAPTSPGLPTEKYTLKPGEEITNRLGAESLFVGRAIQLRMVCEACDVVLHYTLLSTPLECRGDDDCGGDWVCLEESGQCAECRTDGDCEGARTCSSVQHRCIPPEVGGCHSGPAAPSPGSDQLIGWLVCFLILLPLCSRRDWSRVTVVGLITAAIIFGGVFVPERSYADQAGTSLVVGGGSRILTGDLGRDVKRGLGITVQQEFRTRYFGGAASYTLGYFLTTQTPPPFTREFQTFSFGLGPRFYYPIGPLELSAGLNYRRFGVVSNSLINQIGSETNYHAVGGEVSVSYQFSRFLVRVSGELTPIFGLPGSMAGVNVSFGLTSK